MDPVTQDALWAHPVAVLAIPAFIPVVAIVVTILWIARKDRLAEAAEHAAGVEAPPVVPRPEPAPDQAPDPDTAPRRPWRDRLPRLVIGDED